MVKNKLIRINSLFNKLNIKFIIIIFLICVCACYYIFFSDAPYIGGDTTQYMEVAQDFSDGKIDKIHYRTIGFPILLVLSDSAIVSSRLFFLNSLILYFTSILLVSLFFLELNIDFISIIIFDITICLPFFVQNTAMLMSENLTTFCLAMGYIFFLRGFSLKKNIYLLVSGLFWGFTALVRPTFQFLIVPIFLIAFIYFFLNEGKGILAASRKTIRRSIFFIVGFLSLIIINSSFNYVYFDYFGLTPLFGVTLSTRTVDFVEELPEEYKIEKQILIKHRDRSLVKGISHTGLVYIEDALPELMDSTGFTFVQLSKHLEKINITLIKKSPMRYLRLVGVAGVTYWFPFTSGMIMKSKFLEYLNMLFQLTFILAFFLQVMFLLSLLLNWILSKYFYLEKEWIKFLKLHKDYVMSLAVANAIIFYTFFVTIFMSVGEPRHRSPTDLFILISIFLSVNLISKLKYFRRNKSLTSLGKS